LEPGPQDPFLLAADRARAAGNRLARERSRLALLHDGPFDGGHRHSEAASGFSHGLTVGHRSHQALFEVGRIGTHAGLPPHISCLPLVFASCFNMNVSDALSLSITSFHGRGLLPSTQLTEGMRAFASVEAVLGLLIEALFVAAFTRRVTGN
jgi:hypothetical protein